MLAVGLLLNPRTLPFIFALLLSDVAGGQTTLTIDRCLQLAAEQNVRLQISASAVRRAELALSELRTTGLPQVKFKSDAIYAPSSHSAGYDPAVTNEGELSALVALEHPLYDGGVRGLRSDQLGLEIERSGLERRAAARDLDFAVREAFIEVLRGQREIDLRQESVDQLTEYLAVVKRLVRGGGSSATDELKTKVQLSTAVVELRRARGQNANARVLLTELIGVPIDTMVMADGSLEGLLGPASDSVAKPLTIDPAASLDAQIAGLEIRQSSLEAEIAGRERYPTVSLFGDAGLLTSVENLRLPPEERFGVLGYQVGATVEFPLFNWGATSLRREERQVELDTLRMQAVLLQRSLEREVRSASVDLQAARDRLMSIRGSLKAAEDNYLLTKSTYLGGGALSLEVLSAQQLLTDSRLSELQTLAEIQVLIAKLQQLSAH